MGTFDPVITGIGSIVALAIGKWLKSNPTFNNKLVPWVTLLISILTQIVGAGNAEAGFSIGKAFSAFANISTLILAIGQAFFVTGAHSFTKNVIQK